MITIGDMIRNLQYYQMNMKCFARKNCVAIVDEHGYEVGIISTKQK